MYTLEAAIPVEVDAGGVTTGIDAALEDNGCLAGTIRGAATGAPLAGSWIRLCGIFTCLDLSTAADGTYVSDYLAPHSYIIQAGAAGHRSRCYRNAANAADATPVFATVGIITGEINMTLTIGAPTTFDAALTWLGTVRRAVWLPWVARE